MIEASKRRAGQPRAPGETGDGRGTLGPVSRLPLFVTCAFVTGTAWYLAEVDRLSPAAMYVVELQTKLGVPPWWIGGGVTVMALIYMVVGITRAPKAAPRPEVRRGPVAPTPVAGQDWYEAAATAARALPLTPQGRLRFDEAPGLPFALVLRGATTEQARRRVELYAGLLAAMPTPPRGRVYLESCPDVTMSHQTLVAAAFKPHHPADSFVVRASTGAVDIVFSHPDPRWAARG